MKTTSYNAAKELKIGVLVIVFTVSVFTAVRVKELQLNEATDAVHTQSILISDNNANAPLVTTPGARLIDEPILKIEPLIEAVKYKAAKFVETEMAIEKESFLNSNNNTAEVDSWINSTAYKAADFVNADMAIESERFINGNVGAIESEPALSTEPSISITEYNARAFVDTDITNEIEKFQISNAVAENAFLAEPLTTTLEYQPAKFVDAEITYEIEKWMGTETNWAENFTPDIKAQTSQNERKLTIE